MEGQSSAKKAPKMSKDDDETDEEQRRLGNCLQQVLSNPLVCEKIASFLSLSDMKAASQVNPLFLQAMRGTRRFVQEAVLVITDKNAQKSTLEKMEYSWRGVRIDVTDSLDILDDLPRVLKSARFVCLGAPPRKIKNVRRAKDPTAARLLTTVLNSTPALSHLQIRTQFLCTDVDLRPVLSSPAVQETLRNLNHLEILNTTEYEKENPFERNFRLLTKRLPKSLKTFDLTRIFPEFLMNDSANQSVLRLLRNNTPTMEHLSVHGRVWKVEEVGTLTFPVLKSLSALVDHDDEERTLAKFLENQRSLEELTVDLDFHECLMPSIRGRCMELRKLDLTTDLYSGDVEGWGFLGSMNRLKEFRFKILVFSGVRNGWRLLTFLPKNQLECLSLEGISTERRRAERSVDRELRLEVEFGLKTQLLEGFRCLRKLSFVECPYHDDDDAVDDQLMQWLLKEFSLLEEFQLSDCSKLTDAGISGKKAAKWGRDASFADLRRLKTLKIVRCPGVTPNGVLASCVNVPSLKSLEYTNPPGPILKSVVLGLVEQNPRLERLILDYRGVVSDLAKLKAKVKKKNPRVELSLVEYD